MRILFLLATLAVPTAAAADVDVFGSPSGNIWCWARFEASSQNIICTIREREGPAATSALRSCSGRHSFDMDNRGSVRTYCGGGLENPQGVSAVPYGSARASGAFVCRSESTGMTCRNQDGHGFSLSRRSQQVF